MNRRGAGAGCRFPLTQGVVGFWTSVSDAVGLLNLSRGVVGFSPTLSLIP